MAGNVVADPSLFKLSKPEDVEWLITTGLFPQWDDLTAPGIQAHHDLLRKDGGGLERGTFTVYGQAAAELMVDVLKRAGRNLTRKSLIEVAGSTKGFKMSFGLEIPITPDDHRTFRALRLPKVSNGKSEYIRGPLTGDQYHPALLLSKTRASLRRAGRLAHGTTISGRMAGAGYGRGVAGRRSRGGGRRGAPALARALAVARRAPAGGGGDGASASTSARCSAGSPSIRWAGGGARPPPGRAGPGSPSDAGAAD